MEDEDCDISNTSSSSTLSEAEKRRVRRRQRILDNQGARLQRIVSDVSSGLNQGESLSTLNSLKNMNIEPTEDPPIEIIQMATGSRGIKMTGAGGARPSSTVHSHQSNANEPTILSSILQELSSQNISEQQPSTTEARMGLQNDGTYVLPKISYRTGRILICVLAVFLSIFKAKQYMITFLSWEFAFYWMNGLPPMPPPNMMMVVVALMGLRESQLHKLKVLTHITNCILVDLSLFLVCVLAPHIVSSVIV